MQWLVAAAAAGDEGNFARHRGALADDELGVGVDVHKVGMRHAETLDGFVHHGTRIIDELFHGMLLGLQWCGALTLLLAAGPTVGPEDTLC